MKKFQTQPCLKSERTCCHNYRNLKNEQILSLLRHYFSSLARSPLQWHSLKSVLPSTKANASARVMYEMKQCRKYCISFAFKLYFLMLNIPLITIHLQPLFLPFSQRVHVKIKKIIFHYFWIKFIMLLRNN
jgi:hypothetical protein